MPGLKATQTTKGLIKRVTVKAVSFLNSTHTQRNSRAKNLVKVTNDKRESLIFRNLTFFKWILEHLIYIV